MALLKTFGMQKDESHFAGDVSDQCDMQKGNFIKDGVRRVVQSTCSVFL